MSRMRLLAALLLLLEAAAFGFVARHYAMAAAGVLGAVAALFVPPMLRLRGPRALGVIAVLGILAGLPHWLGIYPDRFLLTPGAGSLLFLTDLALLVQIGMVLSLPAQASPAASTHWVFPAEFLFVGLAALTGAGAGRASLTQQHVFGGISLLYAFVAAVLLIALGASRHRRSKRAWVIHGVQGIMVALALGIASAGNALIASYGDDLDRLIASGLVQDSPVGYLGFSRSASLDSIAEIQSGGDMTALRVYSPRMPGYLRGCVYDTYERGHWTSTATEQSLRPVAVPPRGMPVSDTRPAFLLRARGEGGLERMDVWQHPSVSNAFFLPPDVMAVAAAADEVIADTAMTAQPKALDGRFPVSIYREENAKLAAPEAKHALLQLPANLDPRVKDIAEGVLQGADTTLKKVAAAEQYFSANYEYRLGIRIPRHGEPLNYFFLERPAAHCEFFAAGALTLLRLGGVPCRYVTGFVAAEQDPFDGAWLSRNRDAHAWVEAWDPALGWFIVEATPAAGVPGAERRSIWTYAREYLAQQWRELRFQFAKLDLYAVLWFLPPVLGVGLLALLCWPLAVAWHRRTGRRRQPLPPRIAALRAQLRTRDRSLRALGFHRADTETIHQFAARIEQERPELQEHALWYRNYAAQRYNAD